MMEKFWRGIMEIVVHYVNVPNATELHNLKWLVLLPSGKLPINVCVSI